MTRCTYWPTCHKEAAAECSDTYGEFVLGLPEGSLPICEQHEEDMANEPGPWNEVQ